MNFSFASSLRRGGLVLALLALLASCGGVDSGGTGTGASSTFAVGPITGFGSIIVNGVHYDETSALPLLEDDDDRQLQPAELKLGMQAEVRASAIVVSAGVARATATAVRVRSAIVGPLEAVNAAALTVLGQSVRIVATTVFDATLSGGAAALVPGDVLEVYATLDAASGQYVASRIERRSGATAYKLRGVIGALSLTPPTITMGALTIDWSTVAPDEPARALAPGRFVRVDLDPAPLAGVWRARALQAGAVAPEDHDVAEVEGRVTAFTAPTRFAVNGIEVDASAAPFPGVALGALVEVRGGLRDGVLVATSVQPKNAEGGPDLYELEGTIADTDAGAQTFSVRGVTVEWDAATQFESSGPADIRDGRGVSVKGPLSSDGTRLQATLIHVEL